MIENLTLFDLCNSKAKAKVVELLLTCNDSMNCSCRFCTGEYWKVQEQLSLLSGRSGTLASTPSGRKGAEK